MTHEPGGRRVVVTGGAGFLGSWVCEALLDRGDVVVCVDNFVTGTLDNIRHLLDTAAFSVVSEDVSERLETDGQVDVVLHLACPASPADYLRLPIDTMKVGSSGTLHALELAADKGARFVLASTSEVYGDPLRHPQAEDYWGNVNPVGPRAVYDEAKRFSEAMTTAFRDAERLDTGIVRIFNSFGPRMRTGDGRAVPNFIAQAMANEPMTVNGDGSQTRSLCYVDDTVAGLLAMADSRHPGPINIGGCDEVTMLDLARTIRDVVGSQSPIVFNGLPRDDPKVRCPDIGLARRVLDWAPRVPWRVGLERTVAWWTRRGAAPQPQR
jgi:dTDP-glucose 4,6-dehydratase